MLDWDLGNFDVGGLVSRVFGLGYLTGIGKEFLNPGHDHGI
jgi:hypothetical protein